MKRSTHTLLMVTLVGTGSAMLAFGLRAAPGGSAPASRARVAGAEFSADGELQRPVDYRTWRFVSTDFGMSYGPAAQEAAPSGDIMFDNVFVQPQAYDAFLRDGVWPEGTVFVLELRSSETQRPPNNHGYFQSELRVLEVSVKDSARFKGGWAYFDFGKDRQRATPQPASNCFECHERHGAVDMTFVQFYPTLERAAPAR